MTNHNFVFIVPAYNASDWYKINLSSITSQVYPNWRIIYIDDCSKDDTLDLVTKFATQNNFLSKITFIKNQTNFGPAASRYFGYQQTDDNEICCMLDGDDWLFDKYVLTKLNYAYNQGHNSTCGSYLFFSNNRIDKNIPLLPGRNINTKPSPQYRKNNPWFARHLRTVKSSIIKDIPLDHIQIGGQWIKCCSDVAESFYIMEKEETKMLYFREPMYVYNKDNSARYAMSYHRPELQEYKKSIFSYVINKYDQ